MNKMSPFLPKEISSKSIIRDRDYLIDSNNIIFKVIGDVHTDTHFLGYVKYYPHPKGDRHIFENTYRLNSVVSKSYGILAEHPNYYVYSDMIGSVITGIPKKNTVGHYSCNDMIRYIHKNPELVQHVPVGESLIQIITYIYERGWENLFGVTGSFLVGGFNKQSDIDLVVYGQAGLRAAKKLFANKELVTPYTGSNELKLYMRRARYMQGNNYDTLIRQEQRKFQGQTTFSNSHINCEPLRDRGSIDLLNINSLKEIGQIEAIVTIQDHSDGVFTPSSYVIEVESILSSTVDQAILIQPKIIKMISYLGAYTGAFKTDDKVYVKGKLVSIESQEGSSFGIELTPWSNGLDYSAQLIEA